MFLCSTAFLKKAENRKYQHRSFIYEAETDLAYAVWDGFLVCSQFGDKVSGALQFELAAKENYAIAERKYQESLVEFSELLIAHSTLERGMLARVTATNEWYESKTQLGLSVGGF